MGNGKSSLLEESQPGYWEVPSDRKEMVDAFKAKRRFIQVKPDEKGSKKAPVRIMTYNILADGSYALDDRMKYTDIANRRWYSRFPRILAEIEAYQPDIICIQEATLLTFEKAMVPHFGKMGFKGIIGLRMTLRDPGSPSKAELHEHCEAVFYRESRIKVISSEIISIRDSIETIGDKLKPFLTSEHFRRGLGRPDVGVTLHCRVIEQCMDGDEKKDIDDDDGSSFEFVLCSTHLYWNPKRPDIKAGQALVLVHALMDLIESKWKLNPQEIPLCICTDSNSLNRKDYTDRFDEKLPEIGYLISGVYTLLTTGKLDASHFDHPATRITLNPAISSAHKQFQSIPDWTIPVQFVSAYAHVDKDPWFTNKQPSFHGCIDYILWTKPFADKGAITGWLEMPWQNVSGDDDDDDSVKTSEKERADQFPAIPNEFWPSDHLSLMVEIDFVSD